jgi:hypothetical protein
MLLNVRENNLCISVCSVELRIHVKGGRRKLSSLHAHSERHHGGLANKTTPGNSCSHLPTAPNVRLVDPVRPVARVFAPISLTDIEIFRAKAIYQLLLRLDHSRKRLSFFSLGAISWQSYPNTLRSSGTSARGPIDVAKPSTIAPKLHSCCRLSLHRESTSPDLSTMVWPFSKKSVAVSDEAEPSEAEPAKALKVEYPPPIAKSAVGANTLGERGRAEELQVLAIRETVERETDVE